MNSIIYQVRNNQINTMSDRFRAKPSFVGPLEAPVIDFLCNKINVSIANKNFLTLHLVLPYYKSHFEAAYQQASTL